MEEEENEKQSKICENDAKNFANFKNNVNKEAGESLKRKLEKLTLSESEDLEEKMKKKRKIEEEKTIKIEK